MSERMNAGVSIDFKRIADAALSRAQMLVPQWLPGGESSGKEYKALNPTRGDRSKGSFLVNLRSGVWSDFATGDSGGDLISLYAYLHNLSQVDAAKEVAAQVGIAMGDSIKPSTHSNVIPLKQANPPEPKADNPRTLWRPILPAPDDAGPPPVAHPVRGRPQAVYEYLDAAGRLLGIIGRFVTSDGGKEVLPCCFAEHADGLRREWRWMAFPQPRPLYGMYELAQWPELPVLLVEGEKCADAAHELLRDRFVVVTWPGGGKAVGKIDWSQLRGRVIYAWADCDAQYDKTGNHLLPEAQQPGMVAMLKIRELIGNPDNFHMVDIPEPEDVPGGWDIADAIEGGMDAAELVEFIHTTRNVEHNIDGRNKRKRDSAQGSNDFEVFRSIADRFALIYSTDTVYDVDAGMVMKITAMRLAFGNDAVRWWLSSGKRKTIMPHQLVFDPTESCQPPAINLFKGIEMVPKPGDFSPIMELLHHLCADAADSDQGVLEVMDWVIKWLALPLQKMGTKMRSALVFHGPQGAGKNLFFEIIASIYGRHAIVVGQEQLEEKHNDWCSCKLFMIGDEVIARQELYQQKNKLKAFITGETIQINPKFMPIRTERNHVNVVFLSNEDQPLALEETDRRYFVVYTPSSRKDDLYQRVGDCIRQGGMEAFYHYLLSIDTAGFNEFSRPPMTNAKRDLINLGMKPEHRFVYEWIRGYLPIFFAPCTAGQLYRLYQYWASQDGERVPPQKNFTESVKKFVGILTDKTGSDELLMTYKVVKLDVAGYGQKAERVWITKGYQVPDGKREGEWMADAIERFDGYFKTYKGNGS